MSSLNLNNFLQLLFEPGEFTCFTDSPNGYRVFNAPTESDIFFAINPLHRDRDLAPTKSWHSATVGRRSDINVSAFRNFMLELDDMALEEQVPYVQKLGLPYTSIVFSGSRSHHFTISLREPLANSTEYAHTARRLHKLVTRADSTSKNPSRLSRLPFRIRPETGLEQKLVFLGDRVDFKQLDELLPQLPVYKPKSKEETRTMVTPLLLRAIHNPDEVMQEYNIKGRNAFFYFLFNRMNEIELGMDARHNFISTAYQNLKDQSGFTFSEACAAARIKL